MHKTLKKVLLESAERSWGVGNVTIKNIKVDKKDSNIIRYTEHVDREGSYGFFSKMAFADKIGF